MSSGRRRRRRSPFQAGGYLAHFLHTGLQGEADDDPADGIVTAGELCRYLRLKFQGEVTNVASETSEGAHHYQNLVVDRGGAKVTEPIVPVPE